jgi:hypothetical protein
VVLVGHDHLVAGLQPFAQRLRDDKGVLRSRRPEMQLVVTNVEPRRQALFRGVHLLAGQP